MALSRRLLLGFEITGLAAMVSNARTCPSPGVSISSASVATGNSPMTSGNPFARLFQRPVLNPLPLEGMPTGSWAGMGNMAPPSLSIFPVKIFNTSTSQFARVPNCVTQVPMRP